MAQVATYDLKGRKIIGTGKNLAAATNDAAAKLKAANDAIKKGRKP
jgi:hypothetical protein